VENEPTSILEGIPGLLKTAGTTLIALAIPIGAGVAVRQIKRHTGGWGLLLCFAIVLAMSALGFVLILASGTMANRRDRRRGESERQMPDD
jgi:hypothetical protein